jgi:hypothetical protein
MVSDKESEIGSITLQSAFGETAAAKLRNVNALLCGDNINGSRIEICAAVTEKLQGTDALLSGGDYNLLQEVSGELTDADELSICTDIAHSQSERVGVSAQHLSSKNLTEGTSDHQMSEVNNDIVIEQPRASTGLIAGVNQCSWPSLMLVMYWNIMLFSECIHSASRFACKVLLCIGDAAAVPVSVGCIYDHDLIRNIKLASGYDMLAHVYKIDRLMKLHLVKVITTLSIRLFWCIFGPFRYDTESNSVALFIHMYQELEYQKLIVITVIERTFN